MGQGNDHRDRRRQFDAQAADFWGDNAPHAPHERRPRRHVSHPDSEREAEARVKWFNAQKGFGFVELIDGTDDAFLHIRQVEAAGHKVLLPGTTLIVKIGPGQKGHQVNEVLSVDASTTAPEPARRGSQTRQAQSGGFSRPSASRVESGIPTIAGTVKWFDPVKGYGFVSVEGEIDDLFLHLAVVKQADLGTLVQGQAVRVSIREGRKGREVGAIRAG